MPSIEIERTYSVRVLMWLTVLGLVLGFSLGFWAPKPHYVLTLTDEGDYIMVDETSGRLWLMSIPNPEKGEDWGGWIMFEPPSKTNKKGRMVLPQR